MPKMSKSGFLKLLSSMMITSLVGALFIALMIEIPSTYATVDVYTVLGGDPAGLPDVGDPAVILPTITITEDGAADDFLADPETLRVQIDSASYPAVVFDQAVVAVSVGGTCGYTGHNALTYVDAYTVDIPITGGVSCAAGEDITIGLLQIETMHAQPLPGTAVPLISVDNLTTSAGSPVNTFSGINTGVNPGDANATIILANPTVGSTQNSTLNLTIPVDLANNDTITFTSAPNLTASGVAFVSTTFAGTGFSGCSNVGQAITCTVNSDLTAGTGGIVMSGLTPEYAFIGTNEVTDLAVNDVSAGGADIAADTTVDVSNTTAGLLTATNVEPNYLVVSTTGTTTVSFTTVNPIATDGKIVVNFGAGAAFDLTGVGAGDGFCASMNGTFVTSVTGQIVTITRQNDGAVGVVGAHVCTIANVTNQPTAGTTATSYGITTTNNADFTIDQDLGVPPDFISDPGTLNPAGVTLSDYTINNSTTFTINLTTTNVLRNNNSKIEVTFPPEFDVSGLNGQLATENIGGTLTAAVAGQVVTFNRSVEAGDVPPGTAIVITVGTGTNGPTAGLTGNFGFRTLTINDEVIDQNPAVAGVTLTAGTTPPPPTGGGAGTQIIPSGGGEPKKDPVSVTETSIHSSVIGTVEGDQLYGRAVRFSDDVLVLNEEDQTTSVKATKDGTLTIRPNIEAANTLIVPPNTDINACGEWEGTIYSPLKMGNSLISTEGSDIVGSSRMLYQKNIAEVVHVGSNICTLHFSNPITLKFSTNLIDGATVNIYSSLSESGPWTFEKTAMAQGGLVEFEMDHLTYYALESTKDLGEVTSSEDGAPFDDTTGHWAQSYIQKLLDWGIISRGDDAYFRPNDAITRAEVTEWAAKAFGVSVAPAINYNPFPDVSSGAWYGPFVGAAKDNAIVRGYDDGLFKPNLNANRVEALKILLEAGPFDLSAAITISFPDTIPNSWYMKYVNFAARNQVVSGYSNGTFRPANYITRAEVAKVLIKLMEMK